jgi:hypothetical protein
LSDEIPIQNGLKKEDLALNFPLRKVQETGVRMELNGTHQFLVYADDVNLLG